MSERIPAGRYKGRAIAGSEQYATNQNTGTDQIAIDVGIEELGVTLTSVLYFSEKAELHSLNRLRACGWKGDDVLRLDGLGANEIDVEIKYQVYQGKEQIKVDILSGGGGRMKLEGQMDERRKREFSARMKLALKGDPSKPRPAVHSSAMQKALEGGASMDVDPSGIPF